MSLIVLIKCFIKTLIGSDEATIVISFLNNIFKMCNVPPKTKFICFTTKKTCILIVCILFS